MEEKNINHNQPQSEGEKEDQKEATSANPENLKQCNPMSESPNKKEKIDVHSSPKKQMIISTEDLNYLTSKIKSLKIKRNQEKQSKKEENEKSEPLNKEFSLNNYKIGCVLCNEKLNSLIEMIQPKKETNIPNQFTTMINLQKNKNSNIENKFSTLLKDINQLNKNNKSVPVQLNVRPSKTFYPNYLGITQEFERTKLKNSFRSNFNSNSNITSNSTLKNVKENTFLKNINTNSLTELKYNNPNKEVTSSVSISNNLFNSKYKEGKEDFMKTFCRNSNSNILNKINPYEAGLKGTRTNLNINYFSNFENKNKYNSNRTWSNNEKKYNYKFYKEEIKSFNDKLFRISIPDKNTYGLSNSNSYSISNILFINNQKSNINKFRRKIFL